MIRRSQWWVMTSVAIFAGLLACVNVLLYANNRQAEAEINARASLIRETLELDQLHRDLVSSLTDLSSRTGNASLRELLAQNALPDPEPAARVPNSAPAENVPVQ